MRRLIRGGKWLSKATSPRRAIVRGKSPRANLAQRRIIRGGKSILVLFVVMGMSAPALAGPLLEQATAKAQTIQLERAQGIGTTPGTKSTGRKWVEWIAIIGGGVMAATVEETCVGRFCDTRWSKSVGGTGLAIMTAGIISKAMPDPR